MRKIQYLLMIPLILCLNGMTIFYLKHKSKSSYQRLNSLFGRDKNQEPRNSSEWHIVMKKQKETYFNSQGGECNIPRFSPNIYGDGGHKLFFKYWTRRKQGSARQPGIT